jgi:drug/metabolite transporter (DMT)-like permease
MPYRVAFLDWCLLTILVVVWGSSFAMSKIALREMDATWIAAGRLYCGAVVLAAVAAYKSQLPEMKLAHWSKYLWLGFIGNSLPFLIITWGMHFIPSGIAGLLMGTIPLIMLVLAHFFLPGERLSRQKALGFLLGFLGMVVLIDRQSLAQFSITGGVAVGELAVVLGCLSYGIHGITAKRLGFNKLFEQATGVLASAAACSVLFALVANPQGLFGHSWETYLAVSGLGLFPTGIATVVMYRLMERTSPTFTTTSNYLVPIYAIAFGALMFGEKIGWQVIVALFLVLAGIFVSRLKPQPLR